MARSVDLPQYEGYSHQSSLDIAILYGPIHIPIKNLHKCEVCDNTKTTDVNLSSICSICLCKVARRHFIACLHHHYFNSNPCHDFCPNPYSGQFMQETNRVRIYIVLHCLSSSCVITLHMCSRARQLLLHDFWTPYSGILAQKPHFMGKSGINASIHAINLKVDGGENLTLFECHILEREPSRRI